ncbi:MAG: NAD-dependent epimerase/dehydratase family protein [Omnitrophica WOR_2 bacterium]
MFPLEQKKVLITGATGFLGKQVAGRLLDQGVKVRAAVRNAVRAGWLADRGAEVIVGDIADAQAMQAAAHGCQIVIHLAGIVTAFLPEAEFYRVNVEGTRALAEAACAEQVERFVHISSIVVYGLSGRNIQESTPYQKSGEAYCDTKLESERVIRHFITERQLPAVIVQPSPVYGPGDQAWTIGPIQRIRSRQMILVNGGKGFQHPIYIEDAVDGILAAARGGKEGEAYILCGPEPLRMKDFFGYYARMVGRSPSFPSMPKWLGLGIASAAEGFARISGRKPPFSRQDVLFAAIDVTYNGDKARRELGFVPKYDVEQGMQRVGEWMKGVNL